MLRVITMIACAFTGVLVTEWLVVGDSSAGETAVVLGLGTVAFAGARLLLRRGRASLAVYTVTGVILGLAATLAWIPPATPALAALPVVAASVALRHVTGRSLRRLLVLSWLT
jgi:hypothetical protein